MSDTSSGNESQNRHRPSAGAEAENPAHRPEASPGGRHRAHVYHALGQPCRLEERPALVPDEGEVVVRLRAAALNRRDYWIRAGKYPGLKLPCVPGSDGAGVVAAVGRGVAAWKAGDAVLINPSLFWDAPGRPITDAAPSPAWQILGLPRDGTFADEVRVPAAQVHALPPHLDFREAAALPLAGLTAYRALFARGQARSGEKLLLTGIGGGVAQWLLTFGLAAGLDVTVTSGSEDKLRRAQAAGARAGVLHAPAEGYAERLAQAGPFDLAIDSAGGSGFNAVAASLRPGGRLVFFGGTAGNVPDFVLRPVFWGQLSLLGTTMGSPRDFEALLDFVTAKGLRPTVDAVFGFRELEAAFARMAGGEGMGKYVLDMET